MASWLEGDFNEVDFEKPSDPPKPKVNPYYSVARHRAHQQIRSARGCRDLELRRQRMSVALEAAGVAGVPDPIIETAKEEFVLIRGASDAYRARTPSPDPPSSAREPMRAVTPVELHSLRGLQLTPKSLAFLILREDGIAELRDVTDPRAEPRLACRVFEEDSLPVSVHAVLHDKDRDRARGAQRECFYDSSLLQLIECCEPFKAIIAVVDVLRPTGQLLCSQLLRRGPQGRLVGVIAACPCLETPAPFAGPAYGALSALLCLGGESLGMGGLGWSGSSVFADCLAFADRAVAYDGGWPSERLGDLAYQLALASERSQGPGMAKGSFLFGCEPGSPPEIKRAESILAWLRGASQACHTSQAWMSSFLDSGVLNGEQNDGPMWIDSTSKLGRWPNLVNTQEATVEGQNEEAEEQNEENAEASADAEVEAEDAAKQANDQESLGAPFGTMLIHDLPEAPPLCAPMCWKSKVAMTFGAESAKIVDGLESGFSRLTDESLPCSHMDGFPKGVEVVFTIDYTDPRIVSWPLEIWPRWEDAVEKVHGTLAAVVLLPGMDAPDHQWHLGLLAMDALIHKFDFVIWVQERDSAQLIVSGLLDSSVPLRLAAAHLAPFPRLHFAVAYTSGNIADMVDNFEASACVLPVEQKSSLSPETRQLVMDEFARAGIDAALVQAAEEAVAKWMQEFTNQCGFRMTEEPTDVTGNAPDNVEIDNENVGTGEGDVPLDDENIDEADAEEGAEDPAIADGADQLAAGAEEGEVEEVAAMNVDIEEEAPSASLLAFVIGSGSACGALDQVLRVRGEELVHGPLGPSLAYPTSSYGYGCVPPKPWGAGWTTPRPEVIVLAIHARILYSIFCRTIMTPEILALATGGYSGENQVPGVVVVQVEEGAVATSTAGEAQEETTSTPRQAEEDGVAVEKGEEAADEDLPQDETEKRPSLEAAENAAATKIQRVFKAKHGQPQDLPAEPQEGDPDEEEEQES